MTYQKPSYKRQVIAVFSSISNCNFGQKFESAAAATESATKNVINNITGNGITGDGAVKDFIHQTSNKWEVVWGPVTANSQAQCKWHTDNTMYVVKTDSFEGGIPLYIVAIAGTNAISTKGWLKEDFDVWERVKWRNGGHGKISKGTNNGLSILKNMKDENGKGLFDFFNNLSLTKDRKTFEIAVCGHSLGGALSPVMALSLKEWAKDNNFSNIQVGAYPSAGATPGTGIFNKYFLKIIGKENYHSIINANDVVPHAWEKKDLLKIPALYDQAAFGNIKASPKFIKIIGYINEFLGLKFPIQKYKRIARNEEALTTFQGQPNPENTCGDFAMEAIYQHTIAYAKDGFEWPDKVQTQLLALQRQGGSLV